ncbi:hypothetical protein [Mycoavidus cysteinexigens]|nr:hypothetical protein [Mycoavidus cysteinexigens]GAM53883.1 hypothetical protein EBME_2346 [bacterium endosymbiont of Mortierella elongata FMR23-6]
MRTAIAGSHSLMLDTDCAKLISVEYVDPIQEDLMDISGTAL